MAYKELFKIKGKNVELWMDSDHEDDRIAVRGYGDIYESFCGEEYSGVKYCKLSHENRIVLNRCLPWTVPSALGPQGITIGLGDRLGIFGAAQLRAVKLSEARPVLAQQSLRELSLTGRNYQDVIDVTSYAIFKEKWTEGWGADGDHLKCLEDIADALKAGCSMITLDCSEVLKTAPKDTEDLIRAYKKLGVQTCADYEKLYLGDDNTNLHKITFTIESLMRNAVIYHDAIELATQVYMGLIKPLKREIDLEISLDETEEVTSYTGHYFVANELMRRKVKITSLAPRFVGEFHKGVDYIGELAAFSANLKMHAAIAKHFGYKISIHSGSDKFSVFPLIAGITEKQFHIKTSGTTWLMAARTIAQYDPSVYREMHICALKHFDDARAYYYVHGDPKKVPDITSLTDSQLPSLFEADDSRQLIHITYGFMLADKALKEKIFAALNAYKEEADNAVYENISKHLKCLKIIKS